MKKVLVKYNAGICISTYNSLIFGKPYAVSHCLNVVIGQVKFIRPSSEIVVAHLHEGPALLNVLKERAACIIPLTHIDIRSIDDWADGSAVAPENQPHLTKYIILDDLPGVQLKFIHTAIYYIHSKC